MSPGDQMEDGTRDITVHFEAGVNDERWSRRLESLSGLEMGGI